ncbi:MAG: ankyrin repeat domain-containing protein [Syntrophorhabdaceae bacterium]|nr:ankyrin repeat domain-containing protein [Syntrophorhabdaceae bacterium]
MGMLPKGLSENDTARRGGLSIVSQRHYFIEELRIFMARTAPPRTVAAVGQHIIDRRPAGVMPDNPEEFLGECIDRGELKLSSFHFDHDKLGDAIAILAGKTGIRKIWAINQNTGKLDPLLHMIKARIPDFDPIMLRKALTVMEIRWDTLKVALEPPGIACILKNIIDNEDCEDLRMFLASGADPNIRDENNDMAPLHWACWKGDANMVRLLLAAGAYPNVWDCSRYSPLHYACEREDIEIMSLLIEHGADVDAAENDISPLYAILARPEDDVFKKQAVGLLKEEYPRVLLGALLSIERPLPGKDSIIDWYKENHPEMLEDFQTGHDLDNRQAEFDPGAIFLQGM